MMKSSKSSIPYSHQFGGLIIDSCVRIGLLPAANNGQASEEAHRIAVKISDHPLFSNGELIYTWQGRQDLSLFKTPEAWIFRYVTGQEFGVDSDGSAITCFTGSEGWSPAVTEMLVRRILPRVIVLQNRQVFHAASLTTPYDGILLCGRSHAGKSTLASSLSQNLGWGLLDDDTSILTEHSQKEISHFRLHSATARASLWSDSLEALSANIVHSEPMVVADGKYRCEMPGKLAIESQRLKAIYRLESYTVENDSNADIKIGSLSPQDAMALLVGQQVRFNPTDGVAEAKRLASLARMTAGVPIRILTYPKVYERLPEVCERIREDLKSLSRESN